MASRCGLSCIHQSKACCAAPPPKMISSQLEGEYPAATMRSWIDEPSEPVWLRRLWQAMSSLWPWAEAASWALTLKLRNPAAVRALLISASTWDVYTPYCSGLQRPFGLDVRPSVRLGAWVAADAAVVSGTVARATTAFPTAILTHTIFVSPIGMACPCGLWISYSPV